MLASEDQKLMTKIKESERKFDMLQKQKIEKESRFVNKIKFYQHQLDQVNQQREVNLSRRL